MIDVVFDDGNGGGYEICIPFLKWTIIVNVKYDEGSKAMEDISIYDTNGHDVTEDYLIFKSTATIKPSGKNLFQTMDLLKTNHAKEEKG